MASGDKSSYPDKQKGRAEHIEEGYEKPGVSSGEAGLRASATVNKESDGGKKSGSGRGRMKSVQHPKREAKEGGERSSSQFQSSTFIVQYQKLVGQYSGPRFKVDCSCSVFRI